MTQSLLKSRLLASAQSAPEQLQPDFEAQYTEFVSIAQSILYSDIWKTRARVTPAPIRI